MKLRVRPLESKETLKIEVPESCSLQQLKYTISHAISSSSSSSSSLHLSLNRKDEIDASSPDDSLHSIGIASGDLVFFTLNPNAFSHETLPHKPNVPPTIQNSPEINAGDAPSLPTSEKPPTLVPTEADSTEMIDGSDEAVVVTATATATASNSEPSLLKRVVKEALGDDISDLKLLVLAVHSVILESGFVRVDQVSGVAINSSDLLDEWRSSIISLRYTLPEILTNGMSHTVNLKIQSLGHFVNVCGSLFDDVGSRVHSVYLDKHKFAGPLEFMLANSESETSFIDGGGDGGGSGNGNGVFELWKMVKDKLALPLLIDICVKAGLELPPCFMRLPMELKLMILEYLPGDDLAKVCCTCSELRCLASVDELWKKKFEEEFGQEVSRGRFFKTLFAQSWIAKKKSERPVPLRAPRHDFMRFFPRRRRPNPFGVGMPPMPPMWGGDFDRFPGFGQNLHASTPRRTFIPLCPLGEPPFSNGVE